MAAFRLTVRLLFLIVVMLLTTAVAKLLLITERVSGRPLPRAALARTCFLTCRRCLGLRVTETGRPPQQPVLMLSNHISWTDIPVLGGVTPIRFLSKAEVASWPLLGWLARQAGTLFIHRGGGQAAERRAEISRTLSAGESVLVFPEGTTSAGLTVLPFFPRLIGAATTADVPIVPVTIAYLRGNEPCHLAPFIGDDGFHHHLLRVLSARAPEVRIIWHAPVVPEPDETTRELSNRVREVILEGLKRCHQEVGVRGAPEANSSSVASRAPIISRSK